MSPKSSSKSKRINKRLPGRKRIQKAVKVAQAMNLIPDHTPLAGQRNAQVAACSYLLVMVIQRLNEQQHGLINELVAGVEADRRAIPATAHDRAFVDQIFDETLKILRQAKHF